MTNHTHIDDATRQIEAFRKQKDKFFKDHAESPLLADDKEHFEGLNYYPVDPTYRVVAHLVAEAHPGIFRVQTTTGDFKEYTRIGRLEFVLGDQTHSLTAFIPPADEPMHGNRIFVDSLFRQCPQGSAFRDTHFTSVLLLAKIHKQRESAACDTRSPSGRG